MKRQVTWFLALLALMAAAAGAPAPLDAQQRDTTRMRAPQDTAMLRGAARDSLAARRALLPVLTHQQVAERLRYSRLTRPLARARLYDAGYPNNLFDIYFDHNDRGTPLPRGRAPDQVAEAMVRLGLLPPPTLRPDTTGARTARADSLRADSLLLERRAVPLDTLPLEPRIEVFGRSLFNTENTLFDPLLTGPLDDSYRIGPGDELLVSLSGDVELTHNLVVARDGTASVPDLGTLTVAGLTLAEARQRLQARFADVYSGVEGIGTRVNVTLGKLRTNQVYIVGEVERPGAYQVSAAATVFNALYLAGGPSEIGSFRNIEVRRGETVVAHVDLYDYLLRGDGRNDVRLNNGDVIFVPLATKRATVKGAVRREAIYEVREGEGMRELIGFAGGFKPDAVVRRVSVDRILPPADRRPGVDRVLVDVDVLALARHDGANAPVADGDVVEAFGVSEDRRHRLVVTGEVRRPGRYEWHAGQTLLQLIEEAGGLQEHAFTPRAHIYRLNEEDRTRRLIPATLSLDDAGRMSDVQLADRDSVVVYSRETLREPPFVVIEGFVKQPGMYDFSEGMTVEDLVLAAGGYAEGAHTAEAEVARRPPIQQRTDTTAILYRVALSPAGSGGLAVGTNGLSATYASNGANVNSPNPGDFELQHGDRIYIRKAPGYEKPRVVTIGGEVRLAGKYALQKRQDRVIDLIRRAGGLTDEAFVQGFTLVRDSQIVAVDIDQALRDASSRHNLLLEDGDSIFVPRYDGTVQVAGAVLFESRVLYSPGKDLDYYVERAGGYLKHADKNRVAVTFPDGEREAVDRFLVYRQVPDAKPGSVIYVPFKPESEINAPSALETFLTRTLTIVTTSATLLIALKTLTE